MGELRPPKGAERYAEGQRVPRDCRHCKQAVWIVYHGPFANHTLEPRAAEVAEALRDEERELRRTAMDRVEVLEAAIQSAMDELGSGDNEVSDSPANRCFAVLLDALAALDAITTYEVGE